MMNFIIHGVLSETRDCDNEIRSRSEPRLPRRASPVRNLIKHDGKKFTFFACLRLKSDWHVVRAKAQSKGTQTRQKERKIR